MTTVGRVIDAIEEYRPALTIIDEGGLGYGILDRLKEQLPVHKWQAQYQQEPTSAEGALIKREWWKPWTKSNPSPGIRM